MSKELKRQALIDSLRNLPSEMEEMLRIGKETGRREMERPDFLWHFLLQSFATMGNTRGWFGLIGNQKNYSQVTFSALTELNAVERLNKLSEILRAAKVRMSAKKATWLTSNYEKIVEMGGLEKAKVQALAQIGTEAKIAFMKRFDGIGDKYARNIWMDVYHPDFHDTIAVDERIKRITEAMGYSFTNYAEHEQFYLSIAGETDLQGWELDRLLYNHQKTFLEVLKEA